MRALTIQQPWAHLIIRGDKRVENRTWPTRYRGPLAIHAGKGRAWLRRAEGSGFRVRGSELDFGAVIGTVELVDCLPLDEYRQRYGDDEYACGPWCWVLRDARPLAEPVPCRGSLGLWTWSLGGAAA
jgi:activating signal cointegrator 1